MKHSNVCSRLAWITNVAFALAALAAVAHAGQSGTPFFDLEYVINPIPVQTTAPSTHVHGLNDDGTYVGFTSSFGIWDTAFIVVDGSAIMLDSSATPFSYPYARAMAVNETNIAVGWAWWDTNPHTIPKAMRWIDPAQGEVLEGLGETSQAWDVNDAGVVVGWSDGNADGVGLRGFRWENGEAILIDTLGGAVSQAFAINSAGQITGGADTSTGQMHAFIWDNGVMTDLGDFSEAENGGLGGFGRDINDAGVVVGTMFTADGERAFRWENGVAQNLGTLYSYDRSEAWAVNGNGDVVGRMWYSGNPDNSRAFIWRHGVMYDLVSQVINIDDTNLGVLQAYDVNGPGQISGLATYGGDRGYVCTPAITNFEYAVTNLGAPPGGAYTVIPRGLNENGEAVGWTLTSSLDDPPYRAWKWTEKDGLVLLPPSNGVNTDAAADINEAGQVTGAEVSNFGDDSAWRFDPATQTFLYAGLLPGTTWSVPTGINAAGDFVGYGDDYTPGPGSTTQFFFFSDQTGLMEIPDGPAIVAGIGRINDLQVVTGRSSAGAFRWTIEGGMELIQYPGGHSYGYDINENGQVSGIVNIDSDKYGALYTDGVGWELIVNLLGPGGNEAPAWEYGLAVNNNGEVVGYSEQDNPSEGFEIAWVWSEEKGVRVLDDVIEPTGLPSYFHLYRAVDINDAGQILAEGTGLGSQNTGAYLLTPVGGDKPVDLLGDLTGDEFVDELDRAILCAALGSTQGDPGFLTEADFNEDDVIDHLDQQLFNDILAPCPGDVVSSATFAPPADGTTDAADLAYLLGAWGNEPSCADFVTSQSFAPPPDGIVDAADLAFLLGSWGSCSK